MQDAIEESPGWHPGSVAELKKSNQQEKTSRQLAYWQVNQISQAKEVQPAQERSLASLQTFLEHTSWQLVATGAHPPISSTLNNRWAASDIPSKMF